MVLSTPVIHCCDGVRFAPIRHDFYDFESAASAISRLYFLSFSNLCTHILHRGEYLFLDDSTNGSALVVSQLPVDLMSRL